MKITEYWIAAMRLNIRNITIQFPPRFIVYTKVEALTYDEGYEETVFIFEVYISSSWRRDLVSLFLRHIS